MYYLHNAVSTAVRFGVASCFYTISIKRDRSSITITADFVVRRVVALYYRLSAIDCGLSKAVVNLYRNAWRGKSSFTEWICYMRGFCSLCFLHRIERLCVLHCLFFCSSIDSGFTVLLSYVTRILRNALSFTLSHAASR